MVQSKAAAEIQQEILLQLISRASLFCSSPIGYAKACYINLLSGDKTAPIDINSVREHYPDLKDTTKYYEVYNVLELFKIIEGNYKKMDSIVKASVEFRKGDTAAVDLLAKDSNVPQIDARLALKGFMAFVSEYDDNKTFGLPHMDQTLLV